MNNFCGLANQGSDGSNHVSVTHVRWIHVSKEWQLGMRVSSDDSVSHGSVGSSCDQDMRSAESS